ncbi:hypothetical protein PVK06_011050 [Gossypium arboreum]|uniref:Uncharacterized protein n=1 Tax=Gossypium arboreum TaxID=29729 RepID=A0ABR0Q804_GOSAR|nr:hypothetical protein PVK06_011050 [Gossypium arboreum]
MSFTSFLQFGKLLSIYGCYQHHKMNVQHVKLDAEKGYYTPLTNRKDTNVRMKALNLQEQCDVSQAAAGIISYLFQVIFQSTKTKPNPHLRISDDCEHAYTQCHPTSR